MEQFELAPSFIINHGTIVFEGPVTVGTPIPHSPDELDITTSRTYQVAETPPQSAPTDNIAETTGANKSARYASAVPITPQTVADKRAEISIKSERNEHLMSADELLNRFRKVSSLLKLVDAGRKPGHTPGEIAQYRKNKTTYRREAEREFLAGCALCTIVACPIREDFPKWARVRGPAKGPATAGQESQSDWHARNASEEQAHCLPPKKPSAQTQEAA